MCVDGIRKQKHHCRLRKSWLQTKLVVDKGGW